MNNYVQRRPDPATSQLLDICRRLESGRIQHQIVRHRGDAVSIIAAIPGERWEIDIEEDGAVTIERFISSGQSGGLELLDSLLKAAAVI